MQGSESAARDSRAMVLRAARLAKVLRAWGAARVALVDRCLEELAIETSERKIAEGDSEAVKRTSRAREILQGPMARAIRDLKECRLRRAAGPLIARVGEPQDHSCLAEYQVAIDMLNDQYIKTLSVILATQKRALGDGYEWPSTAGITADEALDPDLAGRFGARAELVRRVLECDPRFPLKPASWANYAIARRLEDPPDNASEFYEEQRNRWKDIIRRAKTGRGDVRNRSPYQWSEADARP